MQADLKVAKPQSFYQRHILPALRQLVRPRRRSVWNVDVEGDETDEVVYAAGVLIRRVIGIVFVMVGQAVLVILPMVYLVQLVFVVPGGVPGVIGRQLADVCIGGGSCDIGVLLASYAFAVIMLVNIVGLIAYGMLVGAGYFDKPDEQDAVLGIAVADEHVLELHKELVAAHVLPPLPEEPDDDPAD